MRRNKLICVWARPTSRARLRRDRFVPARRPHHDETVRPTQTDPTALKNCWSRQNMHWGTTTQQLSRFSIAAATTTFCTGGQMLWFRRRHRHTLRGGKAEPTTPRRSSASGTLPNKPRGSWSGRSRFRSATTRGCWPKVAADRYPTKALVKSRVAMAADEINDPLIRSSVPCFVR